MKFLDTLEQKVGKHIPPNITYYLIIAQVVSFILVYLAPRIISLFPLSMQLVLSGQWWRVFTFVVLPLSTSPIWSVFIWYMYYFFGTSLEKTWGSFKYVLYFFTIYILTVIISFLLPHATIPNTHLYTSLFLAFAHLYPDYPLYLFFILRIQVKWLAYITWIMYALSFMSGDPVSVLTSLAVIVTYLLFFGMEIMPKPQTVLKKESATFLICTICGKTENDRKIFYWCHDCKPERCFCEDHIKTHTHKIVN